MSITYRVQFPMYDFQRFTQGQGAEIWPRKFVRQLISKVKAVSPSIRLDGMPPKASSFVLHATVEEKGDFVAAQTTATTKVRLSVERHVHRVQQTDCGQQPCPDH